MAYRIRTDKTWSDTMSDLRARIREERKEDK